MSMIPQFGSSIAIGPGNNKVVKVGANGSIISGIFFDAIAVTYPTTTSEIYTYHIGGLAGTALATVTVVYTTVAKDCVLSVERVDL